MFSTVIQRPGHSSHVVEERIDTRKDGTYLWCDCGGWKFKVNKGGCAHVQLARPEYEQRSDAPDPAPAISAVTLDTGAETKTISQKAPHSGAAVQVQVPFKPQLAKLVDPPQEVNGEWVFPAMPFRQTGWVYEPKWDGHRVVAVVTDGGVVLWSRSGLTHEPWPEISAAMSRFPVGTILDGEAIVLRDGKPSLSALGKRAALSKQASYEAVRYEVFDVVQLAGTPAVKFPYSQRREALMGLVEAFGDGHTIEVSPSFTDGAKVWADVVVPMQLEGLIAKRVDAPYRFDERGTWLKLKLNRRDDFVVVGFTSGEGSRASSFGAIVLASRETDGSLRYRGKSGTGSNLNEETALLTAQLLGQFAVDQPPFPTTELRKIRSHIMKPGRTLTWIKPGSVVATIEYAEMSDDGVPRFPSMKSVRLVEQQQ